MKQHRRCGKPKRYMKCMGYKERQQVAGETAEEITNGD